MKIKLTWIQGARKSPVPAKYACTITLQHPDSFFCRDFYSVVLYFPEQVRTWAELELLVVKDLVIPDGIFYITEGNRIVAEAQKYVG